jgi:hypothetical protein
VSLVFEAFGVVDPLVPPLFVSLLTAQNRISLNGYSGNAKSK